MAASIGRRMRRLLTSLSWHVVLTRRFPQRCGGGMVFVSPGAALRLWRRDLDAVDKGLFDWAERFVKTGNVVWDVGANVGLFSFAAAYHAGAGGLVVAIEPDPFLAQLLTQSANRRKGIGAEVVVLSVAASDRLEIGTFCPGDGGRATNRLRARGFCGPGGVRGAFRAVCVPLDWLAEQLPPPDVLKIDVEGAEYRVLQGSSRLLRQLRPLVLCEMGGGERGQAAELLRRAGYQLFDLQGFPSTPVSEPAYNTLAVPI